MPFFLTRGEPAGIVHAVARRRRQGSVALAAWSKSIVRASKRSAVRCHGRWLSRGVWAGACCALLAGVPGLSAGKDTALMAW